jgi:hypothetical protein
MAIGEQVARAQALHGTEVAAVGADAASGSYVDWGAILAGAVFAAAVSSLFLSFGAAVGLSLTAVTGASRASVIGLAVAAALWLLWVQVSSFIGGGYVAGRLRRRIGDAKQHEVEMRDGTHGLVVWALGVLIATMLTGWLAASGVTTLASSTSTDYYVDQLTRSDAPATAANPGASNAELARILTMSAMARTTAEADTAYAVRQIAARTGLSETDAQARFETVVTSLRSQADTARRYGILIAFLTATSLLIGAVAAWWAACAGGRHRDQGLDNSHYWGWR